MSVTKVMDVILSVGENVKSKVGEITAETFSDAKIQIAGLLREVADTLEKNDEKESE